MYTYIYISYHNYISINRLYSGDLPGVCVKPPWEQLSLPSGFGARGGNIKFVLHQVVLGDLVSKCSSRLQANLSDKGHFGQDQGGPA